MRHTARAMCAETLAIRARLAVHWKSFAEYFGAPEIRSLAFFDPAFIADSDRGTVLVKSGRLWEGAAEWESYLSRYPNVPDADAFRQELRRVRQELGSRN